MINLLKGFCQERNIYKMWVLTNESNVAARNLYSATGGRLGTDNDNLMFTYRSGDESN